MRSAGSGTRLFWVDFWVWLVIVCAALLWWSGAGDDTVLRSPLAAPPTVPATTIGEATVTVPPMRLDNATPVTIADIPAPATVATTPTRPDNAAQVTPTMPPPTDPEVGYAGLPFAPAELTGCAEAEWYRVQAGLPDRFASTPRRPAVSFANQGLLWRESNCRNDVTSNTGCCVGYWQLHHVIFRDHRVAPLIAEHCGRVGWLDVIGDTPAAKQANACVAAQLYAVDGLRPWAL